MLFRRAICLFVWLVSSFSLGGEETFLGVDRAEVEKILSMGYNMDVGTREAIDDLSERYPDSPAPALMNAGYLYWIQNYQEWDEALSLKFEEEAEIALEKAEAYLKLKKNGRDPDAHFAVAMVELMQVIFYVDQHRWWSAFWKSRGSLKTMRQLVKKYPNYHDAKLPLGMQNCYMSRTPGYLKPLAILMRYKGDWEKGLTYMHEARDFGLFCSADAGYYLGGLLMELTDDREASRAEFEQLVQKFPGNLKYQSLLAELERGVGMQAQSRDRAVAIMEDARIAKFPAIELRTTVTLLWSSWASQSLELTISTADRFVTLSTELGQLESEIPWADYVRAEAMFGLGRKEEAMEIFQLVASSENEGAALAAQKRLTDLSS